MDKLTGNDKTQYLLAALIEIYRGNQVFLPETDPEAEKNILKDLFSTAISFARFDESRKTLSEEIFKCNREGSTIREQMELVKIQTPDVLNAKMVAAAHLIKIMNPGKYKLS
ncbi:MAG: hypothetical protein ACOY30_08075 [Bacillota bacterium]